MIRLLAKIGILSAWWVLALPAQAANLDFLDAVVGLASGERERLEERILQELGDLAVAALSAEQTQVLSGVVSAGIFEFQGEEDDEALGAEALGRIARVTALSYRALASGLPGPAVEEIAQAALGFELTDAGFQAAGRALDRLDRAAAPPDVVRSWLGYVLAEGWSAPLLEAASEGVVRAVRLGLDPEQMALALSVAVAQAPPGRVPQQLVQEQLDFLSGTVADAERQRREAIYQSLRSVTAAGVPRRLAYGLYEHALTEGWSAPLTDGVLKGVQQGIEQGLPGEQLALALVVRVEQDGDQVPVAQMVREEMAFVRRSLNLPEPEAVRPPPAPPQGPVAAPRAVSWQGLQRSIDSFIGVSYLWGGETRRGTDCSGFTQTVYSEQGVRIPRVSRDQHRYLGKAGTLVGGPGEQERLERGDLVFFNKNGRGRITHVGLYVGAGRFAHACCSKGVMVSNFRKRYYQRLFVDGGRVCAVTD